MRKIHRTLAVVFGPFLTLSAVTGLLWAYAPYLYLKDAPKAKLPVTDKIAAVRLSPQEAIQKTKDAGENGNVMAVTLRIDNPDIVYAVSVGSKEGFKDIIVSAENGNILKPATFKYPAFHRWIMKLHRLEFFGTKKELVIFPGVGLLLMLFTGLSLFKWGFR